MVRIQSLVVAAVFMVAFAVVKGNQCSSGGECSGGNKPNNVVSMLQTDLALKDKGGEEMAAAQKGAAKRGAAVEGAVVKQATRKSPINLGVADWILGRGRLNPAAHVDVLFLDLLGVAPENLSTEDSGMKAASLFLVNMPDHFWPLTCCCGFCLIAWFLSKMRLDEKSEDMSFYQVVPLAALWCALAIALILFNKFIFLPTGYGFDFPFAIFLMWWHALAGTIATNILRLARPSLMPAVTEGSMNLRSYVINVCPISLMTAASLAFGNTAYLHISVAYIQMVKNTTSAFVFMFSILLGLEICTRSNTFAVAMVVTGLLMTTVGELDFSFLGFMLQMAATISASLSLCLTKIILSSNHAVKLDPMSALYFFSPTVLLILSIPMYFVDFQLLTLAKVYEMKFVLLTNAVLAFGLNMTSMFFMKRCGATTYALAGVLKDVALIILCCAIFGHPISFLQLVGFVLSLFGFQLYNRLKSDEAYLLKMWYSVQGIQYTSKLDDTPSETSSLLSPGDVLNKDQLLKKNLS